MLLNEFLTEAVMDSSDYEWFTYDGPQKFELLYRGKPKDLLKGDRWGYRDATSKPGAKRVIVEKFGETIVFSMTQDDVLEIIKKSLRDVTDLANFSSTAPVLSANNRHLTSVSGLPPKMATLSLNNNKLTSFANFPQEVTNNLSVRSNPITSMDGVPERIGGLDISGTEITDLHNIHKKIKSLKAITIDGGIKKDILGLLLIPGLELVSLEVGIGRTMSNKGFVKVVEILNSYLPNHQGVAAINKASLELDEAGFEDLANV